MGPHVDQELDPVGQRVELSQQLDPGRFERFSQQRLAIAPGVVVSSPAEVFDGGIDLRRVNVELMGQDAEKPLPPHGVQRQIDMPQGRGPGPGRNLTAPGFQTVPHLLVKGFQVGVGKVGPGAGLGSVVGRTGDVLPGVFQFAQRTVQKPGLLRFRLWGRLDG